MWEPKSSFKISAECKVSFPISMDLRKTSQIQVPFVYSLMFLLVRYFKNYLFSSLKIFIQCSKFMVKKCISKIAPHTKSWISCLEQINHVSPGRMDWFPQEGSTGGGREVFRLKTQCDWHRMPAWSGPRWVSVCFYLTATGPGNVSFKRPTLRGSFF